MWELSARDEKWISALQIYVLWIKTDSILEPVFVNLFRILGIDSQPGGIDSWVTETFTNTGSGSN
jgi:hypothetical protein